MRNSTEIYQINEDQSVRYTNNRSWPVVYISERSNRAYLLRWAFLIFVVLFLLGIVTALVVTLSITLTRDFDLIPTTTRIKTTTTTGTTKTTTTIPILSSYKIID